MSMTALDALNRECVCLSLDASTLAQALDGALGHGA